MREMTKSCSDHACAQEQCPSLLALEAVPVPRVTSVLLENTALVKFIQNYIWDRSGLFFSISSIVKILMTSFPAFSQLFMQTVGEEWGAKDLSI